MTYRIQQLHQNVTEGIKHIVQNHMVKFMVFNTLFIPTEVTVVHTLELENWFFITPWVTGLFLLFLFIVRLLDFIVTNPTVAVRLLVLILIIYSVKIGMMNTAFCSDEIAIRKLALDQRLNSGLLKQSMGFVKSCLLSESKEQSLLQMDKDAVNSLYVGKFLSTTIPGISSVYADPSLLSLSKLKAFSKVLPGCLLFGVVSYIGIDAVQSRFAKSIMDHKETLMGLQNKRQAMSVLVTCLKNGVDEKDVPSGMFQSIRVAEYDEECVRIILNIPTE
jgi:hypothetical protein